MAPFQVSLDSNFGVNAVKRPVWGLTASETLGVFDITAIRGSCRRGNQNTRIPPLGSPFLPFFTFHEAGPVKGFASDGFGSSTVRTLSR
jgi:hypothetical protein